jgi:hypothetical protein
MKKVFHLGIVLAFLLALVPAGTMANSVSDPARFDLYAGQDILVGEVLVSNDADFLYVEYVVADPWCLMETHLHVADALAEIPQTKKFNPIPGQFDYGQDNLGCVDTWGPDPIPLDGWEAGQQLVIAAHASVMRPMDACTVDVWQIGYEEEMICDGNFSNYANEFNWVKQDAENNWVVPISDCEQGPGLGFWEPFFTTPFEVGVTPLNEFPYNSNSSRDYATNFDVQWEGELPFGGELILSWSPGASAAERKVVSDGFAETTLNASGSSVPGEGWFMDKYPLVEHNISVNPLSDGVHTINFKHTKGDGTFWDWIRLEKPCVQEETAWGGDLEFEGKNWAMYFTYSVQAICPSITASSDNIELLVSPPLDVSVGALENDLKVRVWEEFLGPLSANLEYDLEEGRSAKTDGPPSGDLKIQFGDEVCVYYVHLDNVGPSSTVQHAGYLEFDADILGLIISGGDLGTFAGRDLMFAADGSIGFSGTIYPDTSEPNYWRGFDVNHVGNLDDAEFNGSRVDFTMWVVNAHDSFRVILPALPLLSVQP